MAGLLPDDGLALNPDATHPPFRWQIGLPGDWAVLDTHPSSWQRSAERLVDERLAGQRLRSAERRQVLTFLGDLVADCQRAGTVISLVQIGRLSSGGVGSAGLHLAWYDSSPDLASLALVHQAVGRQGVVEEVDTPAGTVLLQRDHVSLTPPGNTNRVGLTSLQAFLPLTGQCWTAIVATAGAQPEMVPVLSDLVLEVAGSIQRLDEPGDGPGDPTPPDPEPTANFTPVPPPDAPGVERGFGTLVVHQVEPEGGRHAKRDQGDPP
ncbi:MAG TPA: hypothetical protein VFX70_03475 [Mycobacteriales bacterium]|nr:hypothetical protein [Mycobacteriales bacterium]